MRTTKELVIQAACGIADRDGLSGVTLKAVAEALELRTPSLYNHIDSLDGLLREVAYYGMSEMNRKMSRAVIGVSGDTAICELATEYFRYMIAHPGIYETIQWASWHSDDRIIQALSEYRGLLEKLLRSLDLRTAELKPLISLLSGFLHGYTTQCLGNALAAPEQAIEEMQCALQIVLLGIHQKYR